MFFLYFGAEKGGLSMSELNNAEIVKTLAKKHRAPESVEQFGIEPVPQNMKNSKFWDLFAIMLSFQLNPLTFVIPAQAVIIGGLSWWGAILTQVIGASIIFIAYLIVATFGIDYGIPGQVGNRFAFGVRGASWLPSLARGIASAYWFAFQTLVTAAGIDMVLFELFDKHFSIVAIAVIFAIFQVFIALMGWESLRMVSRIITPLKVALLLGVLYLFLTTDTAGFAPSLVLGTGGNDSWVAWAPWIGALIASQTTMLTDAADLARYGKNRVTVWVAFYIAELVAVVFAGFIGVYAAIAFTTDNPLIAFPVVAPGTWWLWVVLIVFVLDIWFINIMNLYTGGFALVNVVPKLGRFWATFAIAIVGVILSAMPVVVNSAVGIINGLGLVFAPIGGVIIAHYLFIARRKIDLLGLFKENGPYWYYKGFNLVAIVATAIGLLINIMLPEAAIPSLTGIIITGLIYFFAMKIMRNYAPSIDKSFNITDEDIDNSVKKFYETNI
jgi:NCS1 nucleoside transporter family